MARPTKQTVDYFPHDAHASDGDTLTILQGRWGNDGYAFWFKLLEKLADSEGHVIDCRNPVKWQLLLAKTHLTEEIGEDIMKVLAELDAIDTELWSKHRVIWCQNFVNNIADVYENRKRLTPVKPVITDNNSISTDNNSITTGDKPQSKVKESKGKESSRVVEPSTPEIDDIVDPVFKQMIAEYIDNISDKVGPVMSQRLQAIQDEYPEGWFSKAVEEAVAYGKRNLKYIERILERWKNENVDPFAEGGPRSGKHERIINYED